MKKKETISDDYEYRLINDLLKDYNSYARPSLSYQEPTNVTFGLSLSQLIDVVRNNKILFSNFLSFFFFKCKNRKQKI